MAHMAAMDGWLAVSRWNRDRTRPIACDDPILTLTLTGTTRRARQEQGRPGVLRQAGLLPVRRHARHAAIAPPDPLTARDAHARMIA